MHGFEYFVPTEIVFGAGSTEKLPELLAYYESKGCSVKTLPETIQTL